MISRLAFNQPGRRSAAIAFLSLLLLPAPLSAATQSVKVPYVPKWGLFEQAFRSSVPYSNPLQEATLSVRFTSPLGETRQVYGFWDGGRTWRVRFCPDHPGLWRFETTCSDAANRGLHQREGRFLCGMAIGQSRFQQHGPVRIAADHRHFEHADGTPFFWLADTAWDGPRMAAPSDWFFYAQVRAQQRFTVVQWAAATGIDRDGESPVTGFADRIGVNPDFFQRLDERLTTLSQASLLSAVAPLSDLGAHREPGLDLPDDQALLLVRYAVARWGAYPVAWLVAFDVDEQRRNVNRWKRIGSEVFAGVADAPVVLYPGRNPGLLDEFRDQAWADAFGIQVATAAELGPNLGVVLADEWTRTPARPLLPFLPIENAPAGQKRVVADDVRQAAYSCLLSAPPAGLSYGAHGIMNWDASVEAPRGQNPGDRLPFWHKALFMPAAKQIAPLVNLVNSFAFWQLRPTPGIVAAPADTGTAVRHAIGASTLAKNRVVVYAPEGGKLELDPETLPASPSALWFNPRTGESSSTTGASGGSTLGFQAPGPGDWVLIVTSSSPPAR